MTSDAKIGLLLGLGFIFAIAFLINGLPSLTQADDNNELTTNMVRSPNNNDIGMTDRERNLTERKVTTYTPQPKPQKQQKQTEANFTTEPEAAVTEQDNTEKDVRFERKLPTQNDLTETEKDSTAGSISDTQPEESSSNNDNKLPAKYVVQEGDTLAKIAKKFYGEKEGNKLENINNIFDGNGGKLKSQDKIYAGQVLRIPPLPSQAENRDSNSDSMANRVSKSISSLKDKLTGNSSRKRYYTVKEGDTLWDIAYKCLGDGSRYKEIAKLNSDKMESEDHITVGMKLLVPSE
jgi:nucleoid-associated protein YgaU